MTPAPASTSAPLRGCAVCGLAQEVPPVPEGWVARCARCAARLTGGAGRRAAPGPAAAAALAGLILYPLAVTLPALRVERLGHARETGIWSGTVTLLAEGHLVVGLVVLVCSIVLPALKLCALLALSSRTRFLSRRHQALTCRLIEWTGRWGMIDVLLAAVLLATLRLGDVVDVTAGPGLVAFAGMVLLSLTASAFYDPRAVWEEAA